MRKIEGGRVLPGVCGVAQPKLSSTISTSLAQEVNPFWRQGAVGL